MKETRTIVDALEEGRGIVDRGFTFLDSNGNETFLSYDALLDRARERGARLRARGLVEGDRVALLLPDGLDFVPTFLGAILEGIVPVPLYPPFSAAKLDAYQDTLLRILSRAEPRLVVTASSLKTALWSAVGRVSSIEAMISADELSGRLPFAAKSRAPARPAAEHLCFLQFTSGSTSTPKGVMVSHRSLAANCLGIANEGSRMTAADVAVSWLPLYHDMGLIGFVLAPIFVKASVVLIPTLSFIRSPSVWMETIHRKRGTLAFAPNFAFSMAVRRVRPEQLTRWDLSSVRLLGCGAEPIHADTLRRFTETFAQAGLRKEALMPAYGMAEATLAVSFSPLEEPFRTDRIDPDAYEREQRAVPATDDGPGLEVVSCGRPFSGHQIAAFAAGGKPLPERRVGELCIKGPSIASGYFRDPLATAQTFRDGWLRSGDLGYVADGEVFVTGRAKDVIILRGRKYDPQRIEWLTNEVDGIRPGSAIAFSRPGPETEELVVCAEVRGGDATDDLRAQVIARIGEQLQLAPADILLVPTGTLPKTSSGKLQRQKARALYLTGALQSRASARREAMLTARQVAGALAGRARHFARELWRGA